LYVGDSETVVSRHCVGADVIEKSYVNDNGRYLRDALGSQTDILLTHLGPANVPAGFPTTDDEMAMFDVVIFSDVGYNSMIFYPGLTPPYRYPLGPDRCEMVARFVERGGGFLMVGGYLSFAGFNGMARYYGTVIEEILPVGMFPHDDRVEVVNGFQFEIVNPAHPVVAGLDWGSASFTLCGYNRLTLKTDADLVARFGADPIIATRQHVRGRTAVFASDFAPHWAGDFPSWSGYAGFWKRMMKWLAHDDGSGGDKDSMKP
jgi:uncharacterized membrane protein